MPGRAVMMLPLLFLGACLTDKVELRYDFVEGSRATYVMTAAARAEWDIGGRGSGSYRVTFDVEETVGDVSDDGAVVSVVITPTDSTEEGLPSPGLERRSFSLELDLNGEVVRILEVDGITAEALDPDELAFIGTYRPPLPSAEVTLGDEWFEERALGAGATLQQVAATGRLDGFRRRGDARLALIELGGRGPVLWETVLPQGDAQISGQATTSGNAAIDIDAGWLDRGSSTTTGELQVRVQPSGGQAPIRGTLHLELELTVVRSSSGTDG